MQESTNDKWLNSRDKAGEEKKVNEGDTDKRTVIYVDKNGNLKQEIGWGTYFQSVIPRSILVETYKDQVGRSMIKLSQNSPTGDGHTQVIRLSPKMFKKLILHRRLFDSYMGRVGAGEAIDLHHDLYQLLGYDVYAFVSTTASRTFQLKRKFIPQVNKKMIEKDTKDVYSFLFNTKDGISLNPVEYKRLATFFNETLMEKFIPKFTEETGICTCAYQSEEMQKSCFFCNFYTFYF